MNFFRNSSQPPKIRTTPDKFSDDITSELIDYNNKDIYDIVSKIVNLASKNIELKYNNGHDNTLSSDLQTKLYNANDLLNSNVTTRGGKKLKRKSRTKTKKVKK